MAPGSKNTGGKIGRFTFKASNAFIIPKEEKPFSKLIKSSQNPMWGGIYPPGDPRWNKDYLTGPKLSLIKPKI
jgi:hypothetical protein